MVESVRYVVAGNGIEASAAIQRAEREERLGCIAAAPSSCGRSEEIGRIGEANSRAEAKRAGLGLASELTCG